MTVSVTQNNKAGSLSAASVATEKAAERLLDLLDNEPLDIDGMQRFMGATVTLLNHAGKLIDSADAKLAVQGKQIDRLKKMSVTDELTGLSNRRGFDLAMRRELDRCERGYSQGGLLILIDVDNFKAINDTYGHLAGDAALSLVGRVLINEARRMDVAARLGGDEFVLMMTDTDKATASIRAQNLCWQLNLLHLAWHGDEVPVRASLGLKSFSAGDLMDEVFGHADSDLYASKRHKGKNISNSFQGRDQYMSA